jgi:hypothetical protein
MEVPGHAPTLAPGEQSGREWCSEREEYAGRRRTALTLRALIQMRL